MRRALCSFLFSFPHSRHWHCFYNKRLAVALHRDPHFLAHLHCWRRSSLFSYRDIPPFIDADKLKMASAHSTDVSLSKCSGLPDTETKELISNEAVQQLSKRAMKKRLKKQKLKEQKKGKVSPDTKNANPGFDMDIFSETEYYFENGLRKVYPYYYTFSTYAKERWYGRTLQDIFENEFRVDSPDNFRASVEKGHLRVNGETASLDLTLKNGDLIEHMIHRHENPVTSTPIEIIEDNADLVVINKPASIPCHPCGKYRFNTIVFILGKEFGYANLRNIYRLDRLTSGVLILGKTARKTKELENQVLHRKVQKEYVARVVGEFPEDEVEVNQPLSPLSHKLTLWHVDKGGKPSRTTFQRLSFNGTTSVIKCIPHTGRTHQIRVHLQYLGHPIANDPYYNSSAWGPLRGKGGQCQVSFEQLCQSIMDEHNVGLWVEGENPLYHHRLAAVTKVSPSAGQPVDDTPNTGLPMADTPVTATGDGPPEAKRQRLSPDEGASQDMNCIDCASDTASDFVDSAQCADEGQSKTSPKQTGFDPEKWVPDPSCDSCRLQYIEPKPQNLLLYLHALRYKGPTWDYSTKLPDWAHEDWKDPEQDQHS